MSQADFFNTARVRVNGKCAIVSVRSEPVTADQLRPVPFPEMPICERTGQPYQPWCGVHKRYHQDHHELWTEGCTWG
jgi:hypothetical protein